MGYAYIPVDVHLIPEMTDWQVQGFWDGDTWVEPERRYDLSLLRDALRLPESWSFMKRPMPTVWMDYTRGVLCIGLESDAFPDVLEGRMFPAVYPMFRELRPSMRAEVPDARPCFVGWDMREVEAERKRANMVAKR